MAVKKIKKSKKEVSLLEDDPRWYQDAVIYELHVRSFSDSDSDGIGDFRGLTQKLDYLQDLGITALWLLPFYPSPLKDDGYDTADYTNVNSIYGNLKDFREFLQESHKRGLRVITELVLNHTSDQHPWFQRARRSPPGSKFRDFYVWNDTADKYKDARIIFKDFESSNWTWDPVARSYYWHRFYSHQPDLNFENDMVQKALLQVVDFWFGLGVDGLRLDAVPYLYEEENTSCENLPETHSFLRKLRKHVDNKFKNRMLLAEANQWPEDAVAYFGEGDECHMSFHFPLMPRIFMSLSMGDRFPLIDILEQTPQIPDNAEWAIFLRNHDELTLEMVTDEERDFMYRMYAYDPQARINLGIRRRLAPLLGNDRRQIELLNGLLFSLPGTPVMYYGDEIGMGDNIYLGDRDSVRTPMQWSADRNAGFSRSNPQKLYLPIILDPEYHYEALNVEAQQQNPSSLLWWMKRIIALNKRYKALRRGSIEFLHPENRRVLAYIREYEDERILILANLSRQVEYAELDMSDYAGYYPVELFGQRRFPDIGELPYFITIAPHSFLWFSLIPGKTEDESLSTEPETIEAPEDWTALLRGKTLLRFEDTLAPFLMRNRWFAGKSRLISKVNVIEIIEVPAAHKNYFVILMEVDYGEKDTEIYMCPVTHRMDSIEGDDDIIPLSAIICRLSRKGESQGYLFDAVYDSDFLKSLFQMISSRKRGKGITGELVASQGRAFRMLRTLENKSIEPVLLKAEQSNTSIIYEDTFILKLFRRVEKGTNPDLEIGRFLTDEAGYPNSPQVAGSLELQYKRGPSITMGILQGYVPGVQDVWSHMQDVLKRFYELALVTDRESLSSLSIPKKHIVELAAMDIPEQASDLIGPVLETTRLLGQRTAELHRALASDTFNEEFVSEVFTPLYQRSLYQSLRNLTDRIFSKLKKQLNQLPEELQKDGKKLYESRVSIQNHFKSLISKKVTSTRIRTHGDFHLGQVLFTGKDFYIIDFEGEPSRSLSERKIKRSPLRDVAGMLRSFHYAALGTLQERVVHSQDREYLEFLSHYWQTWVSAAFLKGYLENCQSEHFIPDSKEEMILLIDLYSFEKAVYELGYEMDSRPEWIRIPLEGIMGLVEKMEE